MMMLASALLNLLQVLLLLAAAPLFNGVIRKSKALIQGRVGPSVWQPYFDLLKYFRKAPVVSVDASWLFRATPYLVLVSAVSATFFVPVLWTHVPLGFAGDAILLVYLLGIGRFFTLLAAMDTGSAFTGMGSSREAMLSALAEPALLLGIVVAGLGAGTLEIGTLTHSTLAAGLAVLSPPRILALLALMTVLVVETGRVPIDNPATHLELTMIHEGLILEHSGRYLAMMTWAASIKQLLLFTLVVDLFVPIGLAGEPTIAALAIAASVYVAKFLALALGVAILESSVAKMRLFQVPDLIGTSFVFSLLALVSSALVR